MSLVPEQDTTSLPSASTDTEPTTAISSIQHVLSTYQVQIDADQTIRDSIRETTKVMDRYAKQLQSILQRIHHHPSDIKKISEDSRFLLANQIIPLWTELEAKVPAGEYYHYNDIWRSLVQRIASSCALVYYLETEELADKPTVADMMGLKLDSKTANIYLDLEDYLQGLLVMASELSRFTVNCVTNGDYTRPSRISKFMTELITGFGELNLKNDFLRKRYDGLKYDIKKIEDVRYDVSIRGLANPNSNSNGGTVDAQENSVSDPNPSNNTNSN